jgi:hypothetical protein
MRARSQTPDRRASAERDSRRLDDESRSAERRRSRPTLSAADAAEAGVRLVTDLTGRQAQGVVSLEPADGGWLVGVEVVEDRRVPSSTDVLAHYEAEIDARGNLVRYARKGRYARGKGEGTGTS